MIALTEKEKKFVAKFIYREYKKYHPEVVVEGVLENTICTTINYVDKDNPTPIPISDKVYVHGILEKLVSFRREAALKTLGI